MAPQPTKYTQKYALCLMLVRDPDQMLNLHRPYEVPFGVVNAVVRENLITANLALYSKTNPPQFQILIGDRDTLAENFNIPYTEFEHPLAVPGYSLGHGDGAVVDSEDEDAECKHHRYDRSGHCLACGDYVAMYGDSELEIKAPCSHHKGLDAGGYCVSCGGLNLRLDHRLCVARGMHRPYWTNPGQRECPHCETISDLPPDMRRYFLTDHSGRDDHQYLRAHEVYQYLRAHEVYETWKSQELADGDPKWITDWLEDAEVGEVIHPATTITIQRVQ